ncbi:MAG: tetratricopeptide repeat protein [Cyanobacteria bacterium P01_G01_bin.39]
MAVITIREQSQTDTGFKATLIIDGSNYNITVSDPFNAKQEQVLEWYFEEWLRYPILDNVKADQAKASVREYGEELFKQVFQADINAYAKYSQLRRDLNQIQIEVESITPEFQALHWEALQDPDLDPPAALLAINSILIRKTVNQPVIEANVNQSPTINLLVVTARPNADQDVAYRTISRPLVEAIRTAKLRVKVDLLRPGTYEALSRHLEAKGSGYYHVVHFDVHGALITYEDYQRYQKEIEDHKEFESNPYLFKSRFGRSEIIEYAGVKAFLSLEGSAKGEHDFVEASEIANLLTGKGIPVCILNACQSGKQLNQNEIADNRETSLGSRLMSAGMQMVLAMSYSVTVTAAEIIMRQIYTHLFDNQDLNHAIRLGRRELYNRKGRSAYYNTEIELEDWLLPVVYCNGQVDFKLRQFTPEEEEQYYLSLDSKYTFPQPTYGFVGRDLDILLIEKALLQHNILLLQGMGGTGKTTLLHYLREWWQVTNFAEDIFYFGYDEKAYTLQQIVYEIGKQVYNRFEFGTFQAQNLTVQWRKLSQELLTNPYILILDNLESVTGQPLAIQNTLDEPAREEIKKFLASLVGGKTKVILGSRISEQWLQSSTFRDNCYQLRGLDRQARTDLAENILQRVNSSKPLEEIKTDRHFRKLMKLLAGYPLAMEVVLANSKNQSPEEILKQLEQAEIKETGEDKTNNIIKCIDYSHSNLSESAQKLLLLLAPFRGFIDSSDLKHYAEQLGKLEPFQIYDLENLEAAVTEAVNWGLLSPIDQDYPQLLTIQPVLPYFLNTKLKEVDESVRVALREGFKNHYKALASYYNNLMESKEPQKRQIGITFVRWEYENLYQGLQICLEQKEGVYTIWICLYNYLGLINNKDEQLQLTENLYQKLSQHTSKDSYAGWETDIVTISGNLAKCYQEQQNYQQAKAVYKKTLDLISQIENIEDSQKKSYLATAYHQLGIVAQQLREYPQAQNYYQQALEIKIEYGDRFSQASTLHHLGIVAQELREYPQAQDYYQQALEINIEYGDRFSQALTLHQLGRVAHELREYPQAQHYYQQALEIKIEYGDKYSQALTLHQLGRVAHELREYPQAQHYYQQALEIKIEYGDKYSQASTYGQLGILAEELEKFEQAKDYYLQALRIFAEFDDQHSLGIVFSKLAGLYQKTGDNSLLSEVATMFEMTEGEVKELFDRFNQSEG